jgi:pSer/pThr/pTyr-binding forkhead associated (FHA) protein
MMTPAMKQDFLRLIWDDATTGEHHEWISPLPIQIGRATTINTVVLNNRQVSRQHAALNSLGDKIVLIDQGSTNGTLVNGKRIKQAILNFGSPFQIGPFIFTATPWSTAPETKRMETPPLSHQV